MSALNASMPRGELFWSPDRCYAWCSSACAEVANRNDVVVALCGLAAITIMYLAWAIMAK